MELERAVNGFKDESRIGDGEFGNVYRGMLPTGQIVAVKLMDTIGYERDRQFLHEIVILSLLRHPNLVTFIGFCAERPQRVLVYEFMPQRIRRLSPTSIHGEKFGATGLAEESGDCIRGCKRFALPPHRSQPSNYIQGFQD